MKSRALASFLLLLLQLVNSSRTEHEALLDVFDRKPKLSEDRQPARKVAVRGEYSPVGSTVEVEGTLLQVHPLGLCEPLDQDELYEYGWIALVKVESPALVFEPPICRSLLSKAKRALQRGAVAVIFIVHENLDAVQQLDKTPAIIRLSKPIILVKEKVEARKLLNITGTSQHLSRVRIAAQRTTVNSETAEPRRNDVQQTPSEAIFRVINTILLIASLSIICTIVFLILYLRRTNRHTEQILSNSCLRRNMQRGDDSSASIPVFERTEEQHWYCSQCTVESETASLNSQNEMKLPGDSENSKLPHENSLRLSHLALKDEAIENELFNSKNPALVSEHLEEHAFSSQEDL